MSTTTNTLPHDTYANQSIPLWASATAGQQFVSPSEVVNDVIPPTAEITTFVNSNITGSFTLNTIPGGTPLNEIKLEGATAGISLYTNGQPTLLSSPNITSVLGDLEIVSKQTGGTWTFNNNELSYNAVKQLTGDQTFTQLGENTYSDTYGLNVWNVNSSNKTTTISDRELYFTTTGTGATTTLTSDFVSPLVPNRSTSDPLIRNPNSRTPLFPEDAYIAPLNGDSSLVVSPSAPYSVQCTNINPLPRNVGSRLSKSSTPNDWIRGTDLPFWVEVELFDPVSTIYGLYNGAGAFGQTALLDDIKNTSGTLSFLPLGAMTPTTFIAGDSITIVYEWIDIPTGQAQVIISKNNVVVSTAPVGISLVSSIIPQFYSLVQVPNGFTYTLPSFNLGRVSPVLTSFNGWEWTTNLGGLYPRDNSGLAPASGTNPPANLYDSVFMFGGCEMTSPPITAGVGSLVTIASYRGSKLGSGTLQVYQNSTLLITTIVSNSWTFGNIISFTSTGNDTIKFVYTSATDVLSLQRVQISYAAPVDVLDGGMGMNGTTLNLGAGDYYSFPTIQMNSTNITLNKNMNANNYIISNVNTLSTSTLSPFGAAIFLGGNISGNNNNISNINSIRATRLDLNTPQTTISVGGPLNMLANNISNAGTITSTSISNSSDLTSSVSIATPTLTSLNASTGLLIGFSNTAEVDIDKVNVIQGTSISNGMEVKLCEFINGGPACATGSVWYVANFFGLKQVSCPLPPARVPTSGTSITFFTSPDDYVSTAGYTLPPYSTIDIFDGGTIIHTQNNTTNRPQTYVNGDFILDNVNRFYRLTAYLDIV